MKDEEEKEGLVCISGLYVDKRLEGVRDITRTTWPEWLKSFPNTKFAVDQSEKGGAL